MIGYILARLGEGSTWRSLVWVLTSLGVLQVENDAAEHIASIGMLAAGIVGAALPDKLK